MSPTDFLIAAIAFTVCAVVFEAARQCEEADKKAWAIKSFQQRVAATYQRLKRAARA